MKNKEDIEINLFKDETSDDYIDYTVQLEYYKNNHKDFLSFEEHIERFNESIKNYDELEGVISIHERFDREKKQEEADIDSIDKTNDNRIRIDKNFSVFYKKQLVGFGFAYAYDMLVIPEVREQFPEYTSVFSNIDLHIFLQIWRNVNKYLAKNKTYFVLFYSPSLKRFRIGERGKADKLYSNDSYIFINMFETRRKARNYIYHIQKTFLDFLRFDYKKKTFHISRRIDYKKLVKQLS